MPESSTLKARPRPRATPGVHTTSHQAARMQVLCTNPTAPGSYEVWVTAQEVLCGGCGHPVGENFDVIMRERLKVRLRSRIGRLNHYVADDWDDSEEGLEEMAKQLRKVFPYLSFRTRARKRIIFRIATLQHQRDAIENDTNATMSTLMHRARVVEDKIHNETDALLEDCFK